MTIKHVGLGVKYGGRCAVCGGDTGARWFELEATALYRAQDGTYRVVHPSCGGGKTKSKVGGGTKYRRAPASEIEVAA